MRISKLNKLLILWQKNNLISKKQSEDINLFMKERQKEQFFRLIKWFFIIGAFWLVCGIIMSIINFFQLDIMEKITQFILNIVDSIVTILIDPIIDLLEYFFDDNYILFLLGIGCLLLSFLFVYFAKKTKINKDVEKLNLSLEQKQILSNKLIYETISCIFLSGFFICFNKLVVPSTIDYYVNAEKFFPIWHLFASITFITIAHLLKRVIYLIFGLYFLFLFCGIFSGYDYACYWIGCSRPLLQFLIGVTIISVGYICESNNNEKNLDNYEINEKFAQTYKWTGLLASFIALWIISFWGFDLDYSNKYIDSTPSNIELWVANILFISYCIASMCWGAKTEQKIFFNYGLTFLIIETYTLFLSRLWEHLSFALASLILGSMLIATGKIIVRLYIKKQTK